MKNIKTQAGGNAGEDVCEIPAARPKPAETAPRKLQEPVVKALKPEGFKPGDRVVSPTGDLFTVAEVDSDDLEITVGDAAGTYYNALPETLKLYKEG